MNKMDKVDRPNHKEYAEGNIYVYNKHISFFINKKNTNEEVRNMTKRSVKSIIAVLMILTIALYFISGTYARYIDTYTGTGKFQVAQWKVALKQGEMAQNTTFDLTFKPVSNEFVVEGKIAPDVEAVAEVEVDLTGTEVAVDLSAKVNTDTLKQALTEYGEVPNDITVTSKIAKSGAEAEALNGSLISLPGGAFAEENGKYKLTITAKWNNAEEAHNTDHTKAGKEAGTIGELTVPVTIEIKQHIKSDVTP